MYSIGNRNPWEELKDFYVGLKAEIVKFIKIIDGFGAICDSNNDGTSLKDLLKLITFNLGKFMKKV